MVFMAMELLAFHNQLVANLAADREDDNLIVLNIIQDSEVSRAKLILRERIRPQSFDRFRGAVGLVLLPSKNSGFQDSLFTRKQRPKLPFRVLCDRDLERHGAVSKRGRPALLI